MWKNMINEKPPHPGWYPVKISATEWVKALWKNGRWYETSKLMKENRKNYIHKFSKHEDITDIVTHWYDSTDFESGKK